MVSRERQPTSIKQVQPMKYYIVNHWIFLFSLAYCLFVYVLYSQILKRNNYNHGLNKIILFNMAVFLIGIISFIIFLLLSNQAYPSTDLWFLPIIWVSLITVAILSLLKLFVRKFKILRRRNIVLICALVPVCLAPVVLGVLEFLIAVSI